MAGNESEDEDEGMGCASPPCYLDEVELQPGGRMVPAAVVRLLAGLAAASDEARALAASLQDADLTAELAAFSAMLADHLRRLEGVPPAAPVGLPQPSSASRRRLRDVLVETVERLRDAVPAIDDAVLAADLDAAASKIEARLEGRPAA